MAGAKRPTQTHYDLLGVKPTASPQQIRRAYRDLSKLYHPDTTTLSPVVATERFQKLNEAYATLSSPDRRLAYDQQVGYSRISVIQAPPNLDRSVRQPSYSSSAYLDPNDRPLSAGEIFALFILGVTFVACLALVITVGIARGDMAMHPGQESLPASEIVWSTDQLSESAAASGGETPGPIRQPAEPAEAANQGTANASLLPVPSADPAEAAVSPAE